eukprot:sb/3461925/
MLMMTCNRSRVGKKQELQSRALNLIKNNSDTKDWTSSGKSYGVSPGSESSSDKQHVPVLPDVTFKDLPFYEEIDILIKPTSMMDQGPSRYQETTIPFYLSQRQVQAIYDSRTIQPLQGGNVISYNYLVQIQYGTLKRGFPNSHLTKDLKNIGDGQLAYKMPLVIGSSCHIPYLLPKVGTGHQVRGEVYEVNQEELNLLDKLEGYPDYYNRLSVVVNLLESSEKVQCMAYILDRFQDGLLEKEFLPFYTKEDAISYIPPAKRENPIKHRADVMDYSKQPLTIIPSIAMPKVLSAEEAKPLLSTFDVIIDVRTQKEWDAGHLELPSVRHIDSLHQHPEKVAELEDVKDKKCLVHCGSGKRATARMVNSFRVQELQMLMMTCNRSRVGKKQELQSRALNLIKNNSDTKDCKVANSIRDIYNRRYPPRQAGVIDPNVITSLNAPGTSSGKSYGVSPGSESSSDKQHVPVLPDVTFKDLPFYEEIDILIKPTSMMDQGPSRYQETTIPFYLSQRQVQAIYDSRTIQPLQGGNVISYNYLVQIQVRLCLLETSCEQADHFPAFLSLKVNGSQAYSFQEPQSSNVKRPPSVPIDITAHCRLSSAYPNALSVTWASNYGQRHCVVVRLVRQHNSQVLLDQLKKHVRNIDHSKALIKEKLSCDDNEIATTSLRVSLLCPLSKARIQIPCRPTTCNHLQCFDASIFLQMNEKKATWQCPVCDGTAKYPTLAIDAFFKLIISQSSDADEIEVFPDGSWKALINKPDQVMQETKPKPEAISVDSPESDGSPSSSVDAAPGSSTPATWQCPVCDGTAKYPTLAIDAFFKLIISQSSDADEIEVFPDGSWKALINKPDQVMQETKPKPEAISVDSPESDGSPSSSVDAAPGSSTPG